MRLALLLLSLLAGEPCRPEEVDHSQQPVTVAA